VVAEGKPAEQAMLGLFGMQLEAGRIYHLDWQPGGPPVAACWLAPGRLELRVADLDGWPDRLLARLQEVASDAIQARRAAFGARLSGLIARLEAWNYADSEAGGGLQEIAAELAQLAGDAPSSEARREILNAQDGLDDGLPAEAVTAALYRARQRALVR
jgi:hypothetical protein